MPNFSVFCPIKPFIVSQAFGVFNPAYQQFGFSKHNGIDMPVTDGTPAYAMCDAYVLQTGENSGAGKFVKLRTAGPVKVGEKEGVVCLMYMHAKEIKVREGDFLRAGDLVMLCDNTGFSTGHHLHVSAFFIDGQGRKVKLGDPKTDYCFDWSLYWNKFYAVDAQKVLSILYQLKSLLALWLTKL